MPLMSRFYALALCLALASCSSKEEVKTEQYFAEGFQLYTTYCANCHQPNGEGLSNLYPPLKGEEALSNKYLIPCIIRNGMSDTIMVNGKEFSRPMPGNPKLTDIELAEIVTYLTIKWGKDSTFTSIETVQNLLLDCRQVQN